VARADFVSLPSGFGFDPVCVHALRPIAPQLHSTLHVPSDVRRARRAR
jgi:hypothetical protein